MGKFAEKTVMTFVTRVLAILFSAASLVVISRVLGPEGRGIYSIAILLPSFLTTFAILGIPVATVFFIGKKKYSIGEIFYNNLLIVGIISIATILIGFMSVSYFGKELFPGIGIAYLNLSLFVMPFVLFFTFVSHILLGMQKIKVYNIIFLCQSLSFLILVLILPVFFHFDVKIAIVSYMLSFIIITIMLVLYFKRNFDKSSFKFNKNYIKDAYYYGLKIYPSSIFSFLHSRAPIFLINLLMNPAATGYYSIAQGLSESIWIMSSSASTVLLPRVASEKDPARIKEFTPLVCRNILLQTLVVVLIMIIFSRTLIILLFSEKFSGSIQSFQILLIGALSVCGWNILSSDIAARGKAVFNSYITVISFFLNLVLNIFWIPKFGIAGAAYATTVSYTVMFIITIFVYAKISGNSICSILFFQKKDVGLYKEFLSRLKKLK